MRKDKQKRKLARILSLALCMSLALGLQAGTSAAVYVAAGDPTLQFDLMTDSPTTGLKAGDQVEVEVTVGRQDGSEAEYDLYSVMLDIDYNNDVFQLSNLKNAGLKRPDGKNWTGSWNCASIPATGDTQRVRVLYTNIGGLMSQPSVLDRISGTLTAGRFTLTVRDGVELKGATSEVRFYYSECAGSDWKRGDSVEGSVLTLQLADTTGGANGGSGNSGSGSGSGSGNGSGSGATEGTGSGTGSSGADSGAGTGSAGGQGAGSAAKVSFSDMTDVPKDHWAAAYIEDLVNRGIVAGNDKKEFQPEKAVTRAEFAQMIVSAFGYQASAAAGAASGVSGSGAAGFSDVRSEDWYWQPVMTLSQAGVVSGIGGGLFGAEDTLSRQDMAVILTLAMKDNNINLEVTRDYGVFIDQDQVAEYAQQALWNLYCTGIVSGTTEDTLSPEAETTRAQVATVLSHVLQEIEKGR